MSTVATRVAPSQRFTRRTLDCPVCGGNADHAHGQGTRCYGHLSEDGRFAFCTREEHAGALPRVGDTYRHFLAGVCRCGGTHAAGTAVDATQRPAARPARRALHALIPETLRDGWHETSRFPYHDAGGALLSYVVRYDPPADRPRERKRCYPYQPVGQDWACDELGLTRVLYRLPELLAAPADVPVFIVEGEKCVEALRKHGLVATCNPGGAGKWHTVTGARDELRARHVVILPDHDEPGKAHAEQVAADVVGTAASVRIVELPGLAEHGDVYDWLAAGGTALRLYELALTTPRYTARSPQSPNSTPRSPLELFGQEADGGDAEERADHARDEAALDRATRAHFAERERWRRALARVVTLNASQKLVMAEVRRRVLDWTWHAEGVRVPVSVGGIAKACGCTRSTASAALHALSERGVIEYYTEPERDADGRRTLPPRMCSFVAWCPLLLTPADIPPARATEPADDAPDAERPKRNTWGGKRQGSGRPCGSCGSTQTRLQLVCEDCGTIEDARGEQETPAERPRSHLAHSAYRLPQSKVERGDDVCSICGDELDAYDARGRPFCVAHMPRRPAANGGRA